MTFGQRLKYLRVKNNLTQKEVSEKMDVAFQTVSKWESDINEPDIESIKQLASIFNCSIDYLFNTDSEKNKEEKSIVNSKKHK